MAAKSEALACSDEAFLAFALGVAGVSVGMVVFVQLGSRGGQNDQLCNQDAEQSIHHADAETKELQSIQAQFHRFHEQAFIPE